MTPPHCDHECVCPDKTPFKSFTNQPCNMIHCPHDTRGKTPAPAAPEIKTCFDLKEYGESIRNQTLDEIIQWSSQYANKKFTAGMLGEYIASLRTQSTKQHHRK